jgi:PAS domain S-box-containing protein
METETPHSRLAKAVACVIGADARGRVAYFDLAAEALFGYHRDQALGRPVADLIVPPGLREAYRRVLHGGEELRHGEIRGHHATMQALRSDGSELTVEVAVLESAFKGLRFVALVRAHPARGPATEGDGRTLSPREREILGHVARGLTGKEVAELLSISHQTVRTHVRNTLEKLEARTQAHAVAIALRRREIAP